MDWADITLELNRLLTSWTRVSTQWTALDRSTRDVKKSSHQKGQILELLLGYSHPINFDVPDDLKIEVPKPTQIKISGIDKQKVGQIAANIRSFRKPEPYKGKGVKYKDEVIKRKEGKKKWFQKKILKIKDRLEYVQSWKELPI